MQTAVPEPIKTKLKAMKSRHLSGIYRNNTGRKNFNLRMLNEAESSLQKKLPTQAEEGQREISQTLNEIKELREDIQKGISEEAPETVPDANALLNEYLGKPGGNPEHNSPVSAATSVREKASTPLTQSNETSEESTNVVQGEEPAPSEQPPVPAPQPEVEVPAPAPQQNPLTQETNNPCEILFDPCTGKPLEVNTLQALEKRIRDIKRERDIVPVGLYGLTNDTSNYDFLTSVFVDPKISLEDMVSFKLSEKRLPGTDIYEVLSRLFVFFGGIDGVNPRDGGNYKFKDRIESGGKIYENSEQALKSMKCIASKGSGVSDITIVNVKDDKKIIKDTDPYCEIDCEANNKDNKLTKTYIMSVKWRPNKEKNAEHVDLEKLRIAEQNLLSPDERPADSIVFIKSKKDFQISNNRMFRQYVQNLAKTFFGWHEDVKPFLEDIRRNIFEISNLTGKTPREALELQYFKPNSKPVLSLQLHQDIIVKGVCDSIDESDNNLYLIGVLPRGGKTFIAGGLIREYLRRKQVPNLNTFWLTAAPNETMTQVRDELLDKFQDFSDFEFIEVKTVSDFKKKKPHTVFFCSTQLLIASQKEGAKQRVSLQSLLSGEDKLGLVFFDEAHKTGTGDKTKIEIQSIINTYNNLKLPFIFLTATYYNILFDYQLQKENTFIWDYTDVLMTRALATETEQADAVINLQNRFGRELVDFIIKKRISNGESLETMAKAYIGFPDLYFISADFQEEAIQRFEEQSNYRPDSGFSLNSIFAIKPSTTIADIKTPDNKIRKDAYKIFDNLINPKNMISLITPKEIFNDPEIINIEGGEPLRKEEGSLIEPSLLGRINKMSSEAKSRFRLDEKPTLLMFMPTGGSGTNIFYLLCGWASLLMTHKWWRENYEIACVVGEENIGIDIKFHGVESVDGIRILSNKSEILKYERELHCRENTKGLLILAGEKLSMGISLPCTDVVFLFNEKKSPDDIIQKMYRALTPSPGKKSAFIVDLNPVRTLAALYGYTRASHQSSNTSSQILDIIYDTYSWDSDIFEYSLKKGSDARPLSFQERLRQLFEMAEKDPSNEYRINEDIGGYEKKLSDNIRRGMNSEFKSKIAGQFSSKKLESTLRRIGLKEGSKISIENGRLLLRIPREKRNNDSENEPEEDIEIVIDNFVETISDFIKYLGITSSASNFEDALREYETNITSEEGIALRRNVLKFIHSRTEIKEGKDKELLSNLLVGVIKDYALQSSERIFRQMKGKIEEKSLRKESILKLIHKRLTPRNKQKLEFGEVFTPIELIEDMLSNLPNSVWSNPNLKWLDPANGIGNFPVVVFYRLDEGLKSWEPNENKRRKHIIENMLYMIEKQSNNSRVARKIFEQLCDNCNPNILTADSLKITADSLSKKGFPNKYDIIMGNPPFNPGSLWWKFIQKYTEMYNLYMLFIVPSTFTSNSTGEKIVIFLKENGLKTVKYLELKDFNNEINLGTLYFILEKDYNDDININNLLKIDRSSPIINLNNENDSSIFLKILKYIKEKGNFSLFKGKNNTLPHKNPRETDNIKFKKDGKFKHRLLSRLGGGNHEYYWVDNYIKEEIDLPKIVFPRGTASYSSEKNLLNTTKDMVYNTCVHKDEILSNSIMYVALNTIEECNLMKWYLMRSKLVRYIFIKVNHLAELTRTIFDYIPKFNIKNIKNDEDIYKELKFTEKEIKYIENVFTKKDIKKKEDAKEGGERLYRYTRKIKRT